MDLNELLDYVEMVRDAQFCEISTMPLELMLNLVEEGNQTKIYGTRM